MLKNLEITLKKTLAKCAEAEVLEAEFLGQKAVLKRRVQKTYRPKELDERLRRERTRSEARLLSKAKQSGVRTPLVFSVDLKNFEICMEFIKGTLLKDLAQGGSGETGNKFGEKDWETVGKNIKQLHSKDVIHGDLSTSNMILTEPAETGKGKREKSIAFIDFGLGFISKETEDKAVDLLVLKKTLLSTHSRGFPKNWNAVTKGYKSRQVLEKISEIEKRARYA